VRAFQGGKDAGGYLATGEDLQIQLRVFSGTPPRSAAQLLEGFDHTLTLVLIDAEFLRDNAALWDWLGYCCRIPYVEQSLLTGRSHQTGNTQ
jgi:hypothetical protein